MEHRVVRIDGSHEVAESFMRADAERGFVMRSWLGNLAQARGRTRIISQNNPHYTYEIQNDHYEPVAVYKNGQEL